MEELEKMCQQMGIAVPEELPLYSGVYESAGNEGNNRIHFLKCFRETWERRNRISFPPENYCLQTPQGIVLFDSFQKNVSSRMLYEIGVKKYGKSWRISFPKEIDIPKGRVIWTGRGQHFTIHKKD